MQETRWSKCRRLSALPADPMLPIASLKPSEIKPVQFLWFNWHSLREWIAIDYPTSGAERKRANVDESQIANGSRMAWTFTRRCGGSYDIDYHYYWWQIVEHASERLLERIRRASHASTIAQAVLARPPHLSPHGGDQLRLNAAGNSTHWSYWWCIDSRSHEWIISRIEKEQWVLLKLEIWC